MTPYAVALYVALFCAPLVARAAVDHFCKDRPNAFLFALIALPPEAGVALWRLIAGMDLTGIWSSSLAGICAYIAWTNRPRGTRLAQKLDGKVRDLGHRLVVTSEP